MKFMRLSHTNTCVLIFNPYPSRYVIGLCFVKNLRCSFWHSVIYIFEVAIFHASCIAPNETTKIRKINPHWLRVFYDLYREIIISSPFLIASEIILVMTVFSVADWGLTNNWISMFFRPLNLLNALCWDSLIPIFLYLFVKFLFWKSIDEILFLWYNSHINLKNYK